ncbi:hypothetical protein QBC40DRAFT_279401 [Triangularia verruculosa]|uniref:Uncharacterized protein n=1 Tax=Triangularia verruculosa TaxID=2587418 RepID=A0AAN7ATP2_9PEZI|nr:hypothetical protein QBC40DRAFT_279401 [Triangularia verruculosa]
MDWPNVYEPYVTADNWVYDQPTSKPSDRSFALHTESNNNTYRVKEPVPLSNDAEWNNVAWLKSPCFQQDLLKGPIDKQPDISGFHILFPSRVRPFGEDDVEEDDGQTFPREHWYLPFSVTNWTRIINRFHMNGVILEAMREDKCYTGFLEKRLHGRHIIRWFTGVTCPKEYPHSVSMSAVYFPEFRLSLAVIYNCDKEQADLVTKLLETSPEVSSHSLLMAGIFVELQRHRIVALMDDVIQKLDEVTTILGSELSIFGFEENQKLRNALVATKGCEEEARIGRSQLEKIIKHTVEHERADHKGASIEYIQTTRRFKNRLRQIDDQLEGIASQCRIKAEELRTTSDLYLAQLTRNEAREAASLALSATHQAEISKHIAVIAMIYLPITAVSTIFATPVFKFENRWGDVWWNFRGPPKEDDKAADDDIPVLSGYFWIYIILGLGFTIVTLLFFWRKVDKLNGFPQPKKAKYGKDSGTSTPGYESDVVTSPSNTPKTTAHQATPSVTNHAPWIQRAFFWRKNGSITTTNPAPDSPPGSAVGVVIHHRNDGGSSGNPVLASTKPTIMSRIHEGLSRARMTVRRRSPASDNDALQLGHVPPNANVPASNQPSTNPPPGSMV